MKGFRITDGKGFQITFDNGWTVSVQFGVSNYCEHKLTLAKLGLRAEGVLQAVEKEKALAAAGSDTAEIAAFDAEGNWHQIDGDDVAGYKTPAQVLAFMNEVAALTAREAA